MEKTGLLKSIAAILADAGQNTTLASINGEGEVGGIDDDLGDAVQSLLHMRA